MIIMALVIASCFCFLAAVANGAQERFVAEPDIPELIQRLDTLTNQFTALTSQVNDNKAEIAKLRHGPIAFKAHLTGALNPGPNQRIIYNDVQLNLGNAYHQHLGGFLAPFNGTYLFSVSACSGGGHHIVLDLMNHGSLIGKILGGDPAYSDCSSETTITELKQGDEVYVQHHSSKGDSIVANDATLNSFTGVLLQVV
ncbi:heavy metal-binding protein HIP-like [Dreissena polymorpha]|uniref:heavy metal-binding protein HIP-like n=1 Tax=Dreissena polymorpha TaxID=45954 RepID=UPI002264DD87|nr:heavy metal-binding protein HIP-like [Dreissena polymorpha]